MENAGFLLYMQGMRATNNEVFDINPTEAAKIVSLVGKY